MWLLLAFLSAALLGFYDSFKKKSLDGNAVIPVLFLNTLISSLIFLPFIVLSATTDTLDGTIFKVASGGWDMHKYIILKSVIVLASWVFGYFGMKHLPLTIVGPINATRPVMVLVGAFIVFGERLNLYQCFMMGLMLLLLWWPKRKHTTPFRWDWCIILISVFLSAADFVYFYALSIPGAMISIVSMVRRGSVIVSFLFGAVLLHEKNLKSKVVDLILVLLGMLFLYIGSK